MVSQNLDILLQQVKLLSHEERDELRRRLDLMRDEPAGDPEQILLAAGLLKSLPSGKDPLRYKNWQPVEIDGKPVSQTIIEERR